MQKLSGSSSNYHRQDVQDLQEGVMYNYHIILDWDLKIVTSQSWTVLLELL